MQIDLEMANFLPSIPSSILSHTIQSPIFSSHYTSFARGSMAAAAAKSIQSSFKGQTELYWQVKPTVRLYDTRKFNSSQQLR